MSARQHTYGDLRPELPRVLVVDDEPAVRSVLVEFLTLTGFEVLEASDAAHAVRAIERSLVPVELALVDLHLGIESGVALVDCLTRSRPNLPVILMSGSSAGEPGESALLARYPLLVKPFSLGALLVAVRTALE